MQYLHRPEQARAVALFPSATGNSDQERSCDCRDAFATTGEAKAVCGGRRQTDGGADRFSHYQLSLGAPRSKSGTVTDQLDCNIRDLKAGRSYPRCGLGEKGGTWGIGPLRISCAVVTAEIAKTSGTQQRITCCMSDNVTIGVTIGTNVVIKEQTSNVHRPASCQPMNVDADSGARRVGLRSQEARTSSSKTSALSSSTRSARASSETRI